MNRLLTLLTLSFIISGSAIAQRAVCPQDTVKFVLAKATDFDTMSFDPTFTSGLAQYFESPQEITIDGVRFYGFKTDTTGGNSMYVHVEVRNATPDSLPGNTLFASDSVLLTVPDTNDSLWTTWNYYAHVVDGFNLNIDEDYTVVVRTDPNNPPFSLMHTELDTASGGGDGLEEWLASGFQGTGWVKSDVYAPTGVPFDADFFFEPIVRYNLNASFINDPECLFDELGDTVQFYNDGSVLVDSRMYNRYAFYGFPDRQIWNFGDGTPVIPYVNPDHFYPTNGPFAATFTAKMLTWTQQVCQSTVTQIIKEKPAQDFSYTTNNLEVNFKNETNGLFSDIHYTFGDGNTSQSTNPKHKYAKPGTYWVCQTMMTSCGEITHCENVAVATNTALKCGKDSVRYTAARGTNVKQLRLKTQGVGTKLFGLGQRFDAPQSMIVHGFTFYANHNGLFKDSYEVVCQIWERSGANLPDTAVGPLATSTVRINKHDVDTFYSDTLRYTAIFDKPINIKKGDDYFLTIEYEDSQDLFISTTDWTAGDGDNDFLAVGKVVVSGDTTWATPINAFIFGCEGQPCDMDVIIEPLIEYNLNANWSWSYLMNGAEKDECLIFGEDGKRLVEFDDLSSRISRSEIYNSRVFYNSILDAFEWDFGDSTGLSNQVNALHIFQEPGPFDVTLTVYVDGWTSTCQSTQTLNIPVAPTGGFGYEQVTSAVQFIDSSYNADEYRWTFSDSTLSTLSDPIHYFTRVGAFEVCQYVSNVCGSDTTCDTVNINIIGIPESIMENVSIYPNPAQDYIHIDANLNEIQGLEVQLKDFTGRIVRTFATRNSYAHSTWYVGDLAPGAYVIEMKAGEYSGSRKFILSR